MGAYSIELSVEGKPLKNPPHEPDSDADGGALERAIIERVRQLGFETDPTFMVELIDSYAPLFKKHFENLQDAITRRDPVKLHYSAHSLKGACLNIGANPLAALCRQIEDSAERKDFGAIDALVGEVRAELMMTSHALVSIKARLSKQKPST